MNEYVEKMINYLPMKISKSDTDLTPSVNNQKKGNIKSLGKKETEELHTSVVRGMLVSNRDRTYIHQTAAVFSTRVKEPNETYCQKLVKIIKYLNGTKKSTLP